METVKKFVRENKKFVGAILVLLVGLAGLKLAPEQAEKLTDTVIQLCCAEEPQPETQVAP